MEIIKISTVIPNEESSKWKKELWEQHEGTPDLEGIAVSKKTTSEEIMMLSKMSVHTVGQKHIFC